MSEITAIYTALDGVTITLTDSTSVGCKNLTELPQAANTTLNKTRLLLPIGENPGEGREGAFIAIGKTITINWQIPDLFIYKPVAQGIGLKEHAPQLIDYCGKYADAMRTFGKAPTPNSTLESFQMIPGEYEWPSGTGNYFTGVLCLLQIKEVLSG